MENSVDPDQKSADLDLHILQRINPASTGQRFKKFTSKVGQGSYLS